MFQLLCEEERLHEPCSTLRSSGGHAESPISSLSLPFPYGVLLEVEHFKWFLMIRSISRFELLKSISFQILAGKVRQAHKYCSYFCFRYCWNPIIPLTPLCPIVMNGTWLYEWPLDTELLFCISFEFFSFSCDLLKSLSVCLPVGSKGFETSPITPLSVVLRPRSLIILELDNKNFPKFQAAATACQTFWQLSALEFSIIESMMLSDF